MRKVGENSGYGKIVVEGDPCPYIGNKSLSEKEEAWGVEKSPQASFQTL